MLELRVPQDRVGRFSTELFERYQRSGKALLSALVEMYVEGVSTRRVKAIAEELCGHSFSASTESEATAQLDKALQAFFTRRLAEPYPSLIGCVLRAGSRGRRDCQPGGADGDRCGLEGRRQVLGVELANRESRSSWREFVTAGHKRRELAGVEFVVSDEHPGLRAAIREVLPEVVWQLCYVRALPQKRARLCAA